jgi:hypothetical protein
MKTKLLFVLFLSFVYGISFSQDKIYKKGGEIIMANVTEVGTGEVKYKIYNKATGPVYVIDKSKILKIEFEDGHTESYLNNLKDPELYKDQKKNAIKMNFLSPLLGSTQFSFERSIKPGRSYELSTAIIGLGKNYQLDYYSNTGQITEYKRSAKGMSIGAGYKFSKLPDYINKDIKFSHILQGSYAKPNFYFGVYGENILDDKTGQVIEDRITTVYGALMIELGKQWIFSESFVLDLYFGFGYVMDNVKEVDYYGSISNDYLGHHFNVIRTGPSPGFGMNGGIKLGLLLK